MKLLVKLALLAMVLSIVAAAVFTAPALVIVFSLLAVTMFVTSIALLITNGPRATVFTPPPAVVITPTRPAAYVAPNYYPAPRPAVIHTRATAYQYPNASLFRPLPIQGRVHTHDASLRNTVSNNNNNPAVSNGPHRHGHR